MPRLEEVFGISVRPIRSYIERLDVDGSFRDALAGDHHIVIYGSSKQGKTALRQKHLPDKRCVIIGCGPKMTTEAIYQSILRQIDVTVETVEIETDGLKTSGKATFGFKALIPWLGGADASTEIGGEASTQHSLQSVFIGYNLGDAQSISELLKKAGFRHFVVLENFHYLPIETQKMLAFDLRTFHEASVRFIILGVWREANLLLVHNGDLQDRVAEIPVEPWRVEDFVKVIEAGSQLLNISFSSEIRTLFCTNAYGNVGLLQEFLKVACRLSGISETRRDLLNIENAIVVEDTFREKLNDQRGQLLNILQGIAAKSRTDGEDPLVLPYYLTMLLLKVSIDELKEGVHRRALLEKIQSLHHRDDKTTVRPGDISHLLSRLPSIQADIRPPLLHYDSNQQRLKVVDTRQFFVLAHSDRNEIAEEIPFPLAHRDDAQQTTLGAEDVRPANEDPEVPL